MKKCPVCGTTVKEGAFSERVIYFVDLEEENGNVYRGAPYGEEQVEGNKYYCETCLATFNNFKEDEQ